MNNYYMGLLSGTSIDSVDVAIVNFQGRHHCNLIATHSEPIANDIKQQCHQLISSDQTSLSALGTLDTKLGRLFASAAQNALSAAGLDANAIKAVGFHGQTLHHNAVSNTPYSIQWGDANIIAVKTGIPVVSDFRRRDIALGGQGAPLAPLFHQQFMASKDCHRAIINLGGIANITLLDDGPLIGFDIGPSNTLLDLWFRKHRQGDYDENGCFAKSGQCINALLDELLGEPYLQMSPPKSTGREHFNLNWLTQFIKDEFAAEDVQNTLVEFTAISIRDAINTYCQADTEIIFCGGGIHNDYLMQRLQHHLTDHAVATSEKLGINPDWVEACLFAWLAKQRLEDTTIDLSTITGSKQATTLGTIT